jgi:hypothetical protein
MNHPWYPIGGSEPDEGGPPSEPPDYGRPRRPGV